MDLSPAFQTFVAESRDVLDTMEASLLELERMPDDPDQLGAVFRAAHTLKGTAGVFGQDALVEFAHEMESVLSEVRAGEVAVDAALVALLLGCGDHCRILLENGTGEEAPPDPAITDAGQTLVEQLRAYLADPADYPVSALGVLATRAMDDAMVSQVETTGGAAASSEAWHISLRFGRDVLRHGMDPLSFLRFLGTLGDIVSVAPLFDAMPQADAMDAESCYLGLEVAFRGEVDKRTLENVFEFVQDDCAIHILPPRSRIIDYIRLIESLPEDKEMLGELLVKSGALTSRELEEGLGLQQQLVVRAAADAPGSPTRKLGEILVNQGVVQGELIGAVLEKQRAIKEHRSAENSFLRVRADKLDELIALIGELVIAGASTRLLAQREGGSDLVEATQVAEDLVGQIRDKALNLRMVPIGDTFKRFHRVVRDLGAELGKDIELVTSGIETELDKSMIERISDPLMHLVRNAIDHGIEPEAVREQRGKTRRAHVYLNAYHDAGSIVIEVGDDGAGLDREKILARAIARGMVAADRVPSEAEIFQFVMEPGFSTAEQVTNVSGRGIGMDVVRRNVEALRGTVSIDSIAGEGTTVVIRLPLTLAIIDGFLVGAGGATYVVPLDTVVECMELSASERQSIRHRGFLNLRDQVLPLLRLRDCFDIAGEAGRRENIVVVQYGGQQAGLVVDSLQGEFQTVIKPLGKIFDRLAGISGSTILGSGEVALILDVPAMVAQAASSERAAGEPARGIR